MKYMNLILIERIRDLFAEAISILRMKSIAIDVIFGMGIFGLIIGCTTIAPAGVERSWQFSGSVNTIADPDSLSNGKNYLIASGMKDIKDNDLQFKEFAKFTERGLSQRGYNRVRSDKEADIFILVGYGVGNPQTISQTYTTSLGYSYAVGNMWFTVPPSSQTTHDTYYQISLILDCYDMKTRGKKAQLWKTTVTGSTRVPNNVEGGIFVVTYYNIGDLRIQIPYMIAATHQHFGTSTGRYIPYLIRGDDPRVFDILKGKE